VEFFPTAQKNRNSDESRKSSSAISSRDNAIFAL